jgi:pyruvate ferredoxin oxidoreductase alpha subunit
MDGPDFYYPHKYQSVLAMQKALEVCEEVFADFKKMTGRDYHLVEEYKCDDAEFIAIILGSSFGTMKATVDKLREKGIKAGCAMPRVFRPWPVEALAKAMAGKKAVVVYDKHLSIGSYGPMFPEVVAAASDLDKLPKMYNVIYGLGGADATVAGFEKSFQAVVDGKAEKIHYLGVRL